MRRRGPSPKAIQRSRANGPALPASLLVTQRAFEVRRALGHLVAGLPPKFLIELVARAALHPAQVAGREELLKLVRSEEHTSELQSLMRISYAVFCLKKKTSSALPRTGTPDHSNSQTVPQNIHPLSPTQSPLPYNITSS